MARQYNNTAAVFDLDGTLLDTSEGLIASVQYTIDHFGFPPPPQVPGHAVMDQFIGPPIQDSFARAYGLTGSVLQEIATVFRNRYSTVDLLKAVPYDGIYNVLEELVRHGIKPAIATYKRQDYAVELLRHFGFDRYTDIMYGADHENRLKKKDIIEKALTDAGVLDFAKATMIGDSDNDAIGAMGIGTQFVGVTYGFGFKSANEVEQFPHIGIAATTDELCKILIGDAL